MSILRYLPLLPFAISAFSNTPESSNNRVSAVDACKEKAEGAQCQASDFAGTCKMIESLLTCVKQETAPADTPAIPTTPANPEPSTDAPPPTTPAAPGPAVDPSAPADPAATPDTPNTPSKPDEPIAPNQPTNPRIPNPATGPTTPETPVKPEIPATPTDAPKELNGPVNAKEVGNNDEIAEDTAQGCSSVHSTGSLSLFALAMASLYLVSRRKKAL